MELKNNRFQFDVFCISYLHIFYHNGNITKDPQEEECCLFCLYLHTAPGHHLF